MNTKSEKLPATETSFVIDRAAVELTESVAGSITDLLGPLHRPGAAPDGHITDSLD